MFHSLPIGRRLAGLIAGAALALAGVLATPAPARAQSDDLIRFLLGAAAIAVIVRAIDDNARGRYIDRWTLPDACLETVRVRGRTADVYHRGCLRRSGYRNLPHRCEVTLRTHHGHRIGFEAGCMYRAGYRPERGGWHAHPGPQPALGRLPGHCELTYRIGHRRMDGYDGRCLRNAGFRGLPQQCRLTSTAGQNLYDAQCLWNAGYRRARR